MNQADSATTDANDGRPRQRTPRGVIVITAHRDDGRNLFEFGDHAGIGEVTTVQDQVDVTESVGDTGRKRGNVLADVRVADNPDAHDPGAGHER